MKETTKKWLIIAGLAIVCVLLIVGISSVLYKEPGKAADEGQQTEEEADVAVDNSKTDEIETEEETEIEENTELVIETETEETSGEVTQQLQPEPEKTEDEKPQEPPKENEENKAPAQNDDKPANGSTKDGMIYIDGFGWIPNEGGGGSGVVAEDIYENGNKVGIMD